MTPHRPGWPTNRWWQRWPGLALLALVSLVVGLWVWGLAHTPGSPLLVSGGGGAWIRNDDPFVLNMRPDKERQVLFRSFARIPAGASAATLQVEARERVSGFLDRRPFFSATTGSLTGPRSLRLPEHLPPGDHELVFLVAATHTHPLLKVNAPALALASDGAWQTSVDGVTWRPALLATEVRAPALQDAFPSSGQALRQVLPWLALAFGAGLAWIWLQERRGWRTPEARHVRWVLLALWASLAVNNLPKVPPYIGMDILAHLDYVKFIAQHHRLPLANQGWQMFQPPLTYLLAAPLYACFPRISDGQALMALRVLPLLSGLLQVEVCYRAVRAVFPGRNGLQIAGTALGGFLPMNLYLSQVFGNEPLAGLLSGLALLWVVTRLRTPERLLEPAFAAGLGGLLGLALLAKVSVLLIIPVLAGTCILRSGAGGRARLTFTAVLAGALLATAGWYFTWTWIHLGRPFVGGWDPARGIAYWQDPGFVTLASLTRFGAALAHPVYAGSAGFWNGLYSTLWLDGTLSSKIDLEFVPPWNYGFMLASALTALAPCAALAAGAATAWRRPPVALSLACLGVLLLGVLQLHLTAVPSFATLKATYLVGLLPCFAILGASGLAALPRRRWARALAAGLLAAWIVSVYAGYFVL
jgi:hypothetical protein